MNDTPKFKVGDKVCCVREDTYYNGARVYPGDILVVTGAGNGIWFEAHKDQHHNSRWSNLCFELVQETPAEVPPTPEDPTLAYLKVKLSGGLTYGEDAYTLQRMLRKVYGLDAKIVPETTEFVPIAK